MIFVGMVLSMAALVSFVIGVCFLVGYVWDNARVCKKVAKQMFELRAERPNLSFRVLVCLGFALHSKLKV